MLKTAKNVLRRFRQEDDAVVAIQVVIFSVMLLTSTGLVIDFGRAYSAHSQMQSFVDKAALAAANELDGQPGALTRATNAALAVSQSSSFTDGETQFTVQEPLIFLSANPVDADGVFSESALGTYATGFDDEASHVFVQADARTIKLAFLSIGLDGGTNTGGLTDEIRQRIINEGSLFTDQDGNVINPVDDSVRQRLSEATNGTGELNRTTSMRLSAFAVARMQVSYCGEISTMVMCNPFENETQSFAEIMEDQEGAVFRLTSDRDNSNNPMPLSTNDDEIRVGLLKNPLDEIGGDPEGVCSDSNIQRLFQYAANADNPSGTEASSWTYSTADAELEQLRDMCLLAAIEPQLQCVGGDVIVKAAEPETITTSLNTLFDIWDAPMDRVLTAPMDRDFAPDYVAPHGMLTRAQYASEYVTTEAAEKEQAVLDAQASVNQTLALMATAPAPFLPILAGQLEVAESLVETKQREQAAFYLEVGVYPDNIENTASRRNYLEAAGFTHDSWGPMLTPLCLTSDGGGTCTVNHPNVAMPEVLIAYGDSTSNSTAVSPNVDIDTYYDDVWVEVTNEDGTTSLVEVPASEYYADGVTITSLGVVPGSGETIWALVNNTDNHQDAVINQVETSFDFDIRIDPRSVREVQFPPVPYNFGDEEPTNHVTVRWRGLSSDTVYPDTTIEASGAESDWEDISTTYVASFAEYARGYYDSILDGVDLSNPTTTLEWDIALAQTMYEGYSLVERQETQFHDANNSQGPDGNRDFIGTLPEHYTFPSTNVIAEQPQERRRQRVMVINCSVMDAVPTDSTESLDAYAGAYVSELEAVIDVFYTRPVQVSECDFGSTTDQRTLARNQALASARDAWEAAGNVWDQAKEDEWIAEVWTPAAASVSTSSNPNAPSDCWNEDIDVANIYAEFIGIADPVEEDTEDFRSYAVLVH